MKKLILYFIFLTIIAGACKPTEKGYKTAYDAALNKREAVKTDLDFNIDKNELQEVDGPQIRVVDGVKVYILNQRIKPVESDSSLPAPYNIAVGTYKMITNCKSQSQALNEEGYEAFPAIDSDGMYFTIAGSFSSLSDAVKFYEKYQSDKNRVYVGLPDAPVIIFSP